MTLPLSIGNWMPAELQIPIESSDIYSARISIMVLQSIITNDIDHRTYDSGGITGNTIQKRSLAKIKGTTV